MARGVRQGCPASGFLFAIAFDPIFRWLQETITPRNPDNLNFLQPAQCVYADDLAVASSSYVLQVGMDVALSFPKACGVLLGTPGVSLDLFFQTAEQRVQTQIFQETLRIVESSGRWLPIQCQSLLDLLHDRED